MAKKKKMTKEELIKTSPKKLNRFGRWYLSDDPDKLYVEITDMRAVLR